MLLVDSRGEMRAPVGIDQLDHDNDGGWVLAPSSIRKEILARRFGGKLDPTMASRKAAAKKGKRYSDAEKAEIIAFAKSQGRGGQSAAAKKFGVSPLTLSNWMKGSVADKKQGKLASSGVDRDDVLRELAGKGFKIVRLQNALTGEIIEEKIDPKIEKLGLQFGAMPARPNDEVGYVSVQGGRFLVTMTLERLLALTGTKP